jgi:hypothetical protein
MQALRQRSMALVDGGAGEQDEDMCARAVAAAGFSTST